MKKAKEILSLIIKCLIIVGIITYLVFYLVVPTETKAFTSQVFEWLSTPIGITGVSIVGFLYFGYKILQLLPFSKTYKEKVQKELEEEKNKNKAYRDEIAKKVNELNNTKNECIAIAGAYKEKYDILEEQFLKVCETSPNAKINALGEQFKASKETIEKEISAKYELAKNSVSKKADETIDDYNSILKDIKELKEKVYGKETTND